MPTRYTSYIETWFADNELRGQRKVGVNEGKKMVKE